MHVVIAINYPHPPRKNLRSVPGWTVDARRQRPAAELAADLAPADALIVRSATKVDGRLMRSAPRLRVIARAGTGVDNVDVPAATARGIVVMNSPGANSVSVAEHTMALMLALARAVPAADAAMKQGVWDKKRLTGAELRGKTLGVIGLGRIGQEVAARARAFGMDIIAHDPFISEQIAAASGSSSVGRRRVRASRLSDAARAVHAGDPPSARWATPRPSADRDSHHQHGARRIDRRRGARRRDRTRARRRRRSRRFETEPPVDGRLTKLAHVVATPHIAASTVEAQELVGTETAMNVRDFLRTA